jgi:hypothetical protein
MATNDGCELRDSDLQDPPELIEQFYERWRAGYDVVYAPASSARCGQSGVCSTAAFGPISILEYRPN